MEQGPREGRSLAGQEAWVAVAGPLTGSSAVLGIEMNQAIELAVEERNAAGGILGAAVRVALADDGSDTRLGEEAARGFCARPEILGVLGHYNSDVTLAAAAIYHACGLAMVSPIVSNPALTERGMANVFRFTNRDDCTGAAIAEHLVRVVGKRRAVVVETPTMYGKSMAEQFSRAFLERGGSIAVRRQAREGERDFSGLASSLPAGFDLLFYGGSFEGAYILRSMRAAGLGQLFAAGDGCWDARNFLEPAGDAATSGEGVLVLSATPEVGRVAGSREFAERYARRHGPIGNYAANSYDSARLLLAAIEQAALSRGGMPSRADVVDAIRHADFQGIAYARPVRWDAKGDNAAAVTALNVIDGGVYREIAEIAKKPASPC